MKKYKFKVWVSGDKRSWEFVMILADAIEQAWTKLISELSTWKKELFSKILKMELYSVV